jgi:hypothetical protein
MIKQLRLLLIAASIDHRSGFGDYIQGRDWYAALYNDGKWVFSFYQHDRWVDLRNACLEEMFAKIQELSA